LRSREPISSDSGQIHVHRVSSNTFGAAASPVAAFLRDSRIS
jgi:hypothetical protein